MQRRKFLKYLASSGLGLSLPLAGSIVNAAEPQRFWVLVNAGGGWDPTYFIDPKGNRARLDGRGPVNNYSVNAITSTGNIAFPSSYPTDIDPPDANSPGHFANFFPRHGHRLLVINGIDTGTNNHDAGSRFVWSGKIEEGYPNFGALAAAATAPSEPLAFISNGGYDHTAALVAPARIGDGDAFQLLAYPNAGRPWKEVGEQTPYFPDSIYGEIERARRERLNRLIAASSLPLHKQQLNELVMARIGDNNLNRLVSRLPERVSRGLEGQAEVAVAAFSSGVAVAANMHIGGFDTHGNHDQNHANRLDQLLSGIDHLWNQIEANNLADNICLQNHPLLFFSCDDGATELRYRTYSRFSGFEAESEAEELKTLTFLVNYLKRFLNFKGRDFTSSIPLSGRYRRMHEVYQPMLPGLRKNRLNADQIIKILLQVSSS